MRNWVFLCIAVYLCFLIFNYVSQGIWVKWYLQKQSSHVDNDFSNSFAGAFNEKVTRTVRQFSPHLAAKMRPPLT